MASWLPETLFEIVGQGPAPSKDYYQLLITRTQTGSPIAHTSFEFAIIAKDEPLGLQIIFRWWKISLRSEYRSAKPGETKESHEDFLDNSHLQVQVAVVFGGKILDYVFNLCKGKFDYLERLSDRLLLKIICYLDLEDIASLSQTSSKFEKLCKSDLLWEQIVQSTCDTITPDMRALAKNMGWRQMFLTNNIQHQRQTRKKEQRQENQPEKLA